MSKLSNPNRPNPVRKELLRYATRLLPLRTLLSITSAQMVYAIHTAFLPPCLGLSAAVMMHFQRDHAISDRCGLDVALGLPSQLEEQLLEQTLERARSAKHDDAVDTATGDAGADLAEDA